MDTKVAWLLTKEQANDLINIIAITPTPWFKTNPLMQSLSMAIAKHERHFKDTKVEEEVEAVDGPPE